MLLSARAAYAGHAGPHPAGPMGCVRTCGARSSVYHICEKRVFWKMFQNNMPEGGLLVFKRSPYKTSKSPSQPGGGFPPLPLGFA